MSESNGNEPLDLTAEIDCGDLAPVMVPIRAGGLVKWFLREPSDETILKYQGWSLKSAQIVDGKVNRHNLDGLVEAETHLVAACLCEAEEAGGRPKVVNGNVVPVPVNVVKGWPGRVKRELYQRLVKIAPHINPTPTTRDGIEKQIKRLQDELKKLDDGKEAESDSKKQPGAGTDAFA